MLSQHSGPSVIGTAPGAQWGNCMIYSVNKCIGHWIYFMESSFPATLGIEYNYPWASLLAQMIKNLPTMQETEVWSQGGEDPLEKGMAPIPIFLPGESYGQRSLVGYSPWGLKESDMTEWLTHSYWQPPYLCIFLIVFVQATSLALKIETERVRGRKARGLQTGNRLQVSEIFYLF